MDLFPVFLSKDLQKAYSEVAFRVAPSCLSGVRTPF